MATELYTNIPTTAVTRPVIEVYIYIHIYAYVDHHYNSDAERDTKREKFTSHYHIIFFIFSYSWSKFRFEILGFALKCMFRFEVGTLQKWCPTDNTLMLLFLEILLWFCFAVQETFQHYFITVLTIF
uniref:Uncharacterized protein n=1 Tax=Glossina pallidipes TaxID=7398 RepID=A0A1A9ZWN1_GLOPL